MKDIFEAGRSDLFFYHYCDILFALKNDNNEKNEERKYNGLKEKIFTNKMVHQF